jgi:hypothetical protein
MSPLQIDSAGNGIGAAQRAEEEKLLAASGK